MEMRNCEGCGTPFFPKVKQQRYCSKKCHKRCYCRMYRAGFRSKDFEPTKPSTFFIDEKTRRAERRRLARQEKRLSEVSNGSV